MDRRLTAVANLMSTTSKIMRGSAKSMYTKEGDY